MTRALDQAILQSSEIPLAEMRRLMVGEVAICLAHTEDGGWYAIDDTCTHEDCSLSQGELTDHLVECPCHGSRFDVRTGEVLNLPAVIPVWTHRVAVTGDQVLVDVDPTPVGGPWR